MTQHQKLDPTTIHDTPAKVSDFLNLHEIVAKARQNLNQNDWDYIVGGAESETTLRRNRMALETARVPAAHPARRQQRRRFGHAVRPQDAAAADLRAGRLARKLPCGGRGVRRARRRAVRRRRIC